MKKVLLLLSGIMLTSALFAQAFVNGELDGPIGAPSLPPSWQDVPDTDPNSMALSPIEATSDVFDATGPNLPGGMAATPFSGSSCVSGLLASSTVGGNFFWHEGVMQTVNGFTPGDSYNICFYQAVVKQNNATDTSGAWNVYFDNTLIGTSNITVSYLAPNDPNVVWELQTVSFTATAASHVIKFLPADDDAVTSTAIGNDGALRMGLDLVSFSLGSSNPTITPAGPFCLSDPAVMLTAVDGGGTWTGIGITNGATGEFDPVVAGIGNHTITYTLMSGCGVPVSDDIVINVTASSDASWTTPGAICEADGPIDLSLLITGDPGGTWSGTGVTGNIFDPTGLSGNITVTYDVGTPPCDASSSQDINVVANPNPTWTAPNNLCNTSPPFDLSTTITGTTGGTWSGTGVTGNMFDPSVGTQSITYTVGSGSCQQVLTQTITVGTGADPSWTTLNFCLGDAPYDLTAQITGDLGGTWSGNGITGSTFDPAAGTQDITYTVGTGTCQQSSTQSITVVDLQLTTSGTSISCFGQTDGTASVTVSGGSGSETYSWNPSGQTTQTATGLAAGTYTVTVTDGACSRIGTVNITEPPELTLSVITVNGCSPSLGSAEAMVQGGTPSYTYTWSPSGQTNEMATDLDSNMHIVTVTDANGCTVTDSGLVQILPPPNLLTLSDTMITYPECINLVATGAASYLWEPNFDLVCENCASTLACPTQTTEYCVTGTNLQGCAKTECFTVKVDIICGDIFVPSAFSPDDDGENDLLCVYSNCLETVDFTVYNRWGEKVFETSNPDICWDGNWKGKPLNSAVFVYMLEGYLINGQQISQKGNISLIR